MKKDPKMKKDPVADTLILVWCYVLAQPMIFQRVRRPDGRQGVQALWWCGQSVLALCRGLNPWSMSRGGVCV